MESQTIQTMTWKELMDFYEQRFRSMVEHSESTYFGTLLCATVKDVDVSIAHVNRTLQGESKHFTKVFLSNVQHLMSLIFSYGYSKKVITGDTVTSIIRDLILNLEMTRDRLKELD